jgi:hypothetical protein
MRAVEEGGWGAAAVQIGRGDPPPRSDTRREMDQLTIVSGDGHVAAPIEILLAGAR